MLKVSRLAECLEEILTVNAQEAAISSKWTKRTPRKLDGARFAQTLTLGWLGEPNASLGLLSQSAASLGTEVSAQALDQRFNPESAELMRQVLAAAVDKVLTAEPVAIELLQRFNAVEIADSSVVRLPEALAPLWQGCGGQASHARAALKLYVRLDLNSGTLRGPLLAQGRCADVRSPLQELELPAGALKIEDLGFFSTQNFAALSARGVYWLSRLQSQTALYKPDGERLELLSCLPRYEEEVLDIPVLLGARPRLAARLIAARVPQSVANDRRRRLRAGAIERRFALSEKALALCDWTMMVTNVPSEMLSPQEAVVLVRARWQIERLFRLWKEHGLIDQWRSEKPWRILTELYAKLLAVLIQHWCTLTALWDVPARSLVKAAQSVRQHAKLLASAFHGVLALSAALEQIRFTLRCGCRLNSRKKAPSTYQLLEQPELLEYF
jgi:hypothetical protein